MSRSPYYGQLNIASLPSEVKAIWYSRDEELPELPQHRWSWELQDDMEDVERRELAMKILESVALDARHKFVLHRRIIDEATLQEVAKELGLSRERVRQMERKILRHLRTVQSKFTGIKPVDLLDARVCTWRHWKWDKDPSNFGPDDGDEFVWNDDWWTRLKSSQDPQDQDLVNWFYRWRGSRPGRAGA